MIALYPKPEQIQALQKSPVDQPVVMLNLLRCKEQASAPDEGLSGQAAYERYGAAMRRIVEGKGGRFLWMGRVDSQVIGGSAEGFHLAAGLEGQWLLATTTLGA
jgi:hypothetical protein